MENKEYGHSAINPHLVDNIGEKAAVQLLYSKRFSLSGVALVILAKLMERHQITDTLVINTKYGVAELPPEVVTGVENDPVPPTEGGTDETTEED